MQSFLLSNIVFFLALSLTHTDSQVCVRWAQLCSNKTQQQMELSDSKEVTLDFNFDIYRAFTSTSGDRREQPLRNAINYQVILNVVRRQ